MHSDGVVVRVIENEDKVLVCDDAYPLKVDVSDERIMVLESICFEWKRFFAEKLSVDSAFRDVLNNADLFNASSEEVEVARRKRVDDEKSKFLNAVSKKCVDRCYLRMKGDLGLLLVPLGISDVDMEWAYAHLESRVAFHLNEVKDGIVVARRLEHEKNGGGAVHNRGLFADKGVYVVLSLHGLDPSPLPLSDESVKDITNMSLERFISYVLQEDLNKRASINKAQHETQREQHEAKREVRSLRGLKCGLAARTVISLDNMSEVTQLVVLNKTKEAAHRTLLEVNVQVAKVKVAMLIRARGLREYKPEEHLISAYIKRLRNYIHVSQYRLNKLRHKEHTSDNRELRRAAATISLTRTSRK